MHIYVMYDKLIYVIFKIILGMHLHVSRVDN